MDAFVLGAGGALLAVLFHVGSARWLGGRLQLLAIPVLGLVGLFAVGLYWSSSRAPVGIEAWLVGAILPESLCVSYGLLFLGIAHDSPTVALVNYIADEGGRGLAVEDLEGFVASHPFVAVRLDALVTSGVLKERDGVLVYTGSVGPLMRLSETYRLLSRQSERAG
jgi:hypothetical protein